MTERRPCPPAPGPLEVFAGHFDPLFGTLAQRRGFREYLHSTRRLPLPHTDAREPTGAHPRGADEVRNDYRSLLIVTRGAAG
jgi:hypothetical protein